MSAPLVLAALWIGMSLFLAFLFVTKRISETTVVGLVAFFLGVVLTWAFVSGEYAAAQKWRDGGQQVAIACGHSAECIDWLRVTESPTVTDLPGQNIWLALCGDARSRSLFGKAVPCSGGGG